MRLASIPSAAAFAAAAPCGGDAAEWGRAWALHYATEAGALTDIYALDHFSVLSNGK